MEARTDKVYREMSSHLPDPASMSQDQIVSELRANFFGATTHPQGLDVVCGYQTDDDCRSLHLATNLQNLHALHVAGAYVTDDRLSWVAKCKAIKKLRLNEVSVSSGGIHFLSEHLDLEWLAWISLLNGPQSYEPLGNFRSLQELTLMIPQRVGGMAPLGRLSQLRKLGCYNESPMIDLEWTQDCHRLESISFSGSQNSTKRTTHVNDSSLAGLSCHPSLQKCFVPFAEITDESVSVLTSLRRLTTIDLDFTRLSCDGLSKICSISSLQYLSVIGLEVNETVAKSILSNPILQTLSISKDLTSNKVLNILKKRGPSNLSVS
jgi:hypothetical protein